MSKYYVSIHHEFKGAIFKLNNGQVYSFSYGGSDVKWRKKYYALDQLKETSVKEFLSRSTDTAYNDYLKVNLKTEVYVDLLSIPLT